MRIIPAFFVILLLCSACSSHSPINQEMQTKLQGSWQSTNSPVCEANFHTITFNNKTLEISYDEQGFISEAEARKTFVYTILSTEKNLIRVQLENETRLDKKGNPVVWHLKPLRNDKYCWGRDDWPDLSCTASRYKCTVSN